MKAKPFSELAQLMPVLISLLFGVLCTFLIMNSAIEIYAITPFSESTAGSLGNAIYFVVLVATGASLLYILLKRRKLQMITLVTKIALIMAAFLLSNIYLLALFSRFPSIYTDAIALALSVPITVTCYFAIFRTKNFVYQITILLLGGALGTFLGVSVPTLSTILILAFLAIYDMIAVYYGPVGKMARAGLEQFRGLSFSFRDIEMGLGDLTFYSMLSGHLLFSFGFFSCLASLIGILFGCFISFKTLERKRMFPGLPIPLFFGLLLGFIVIYIPI